MDICLAIYKCVIAIENIIFIMNSNLPGIVNYPYNFFCGFSTNYSLRLPPAQTHPDNFLQYIIVIIPKTDRDIDLFH